MTAPDRAALFPYLGGRGFAPLLSLAAISGAAATLPAVLVMHRPELAVDLELSRVGTDRLLALVLGAVAIGALVGSRLGTPRIARIAVQIGGVTLAAAAAALAALNDTQPLRVVLLVAGLESGLVWSLTRTVALDLCGDRAGWRVIAVPWAGAALGVVVVSMYDLSVNAANWGYELGGAAVVAFLGAMVIPPERAASPDAGGVATPRVAGGPIVLTALLVGAATVGVAPTAWDLLASKWALERSEIAATIVLVAGAALVVAAIGHWFGRQAERTPQQLASASQVLAAVTAALVALGAASVTEVGALLCWAAAAGAAVLFAVSAETALLTGRDPAARAASDGALVAVAALGAGAAMALITAVNGVSRGWLIVGAAAPALVVAAMSVLAEPKATEATVSATPNPTSDSTEPSRAMTTSRSQPLLVCRGIEVSYGNVQVLFGVDLCVEEGQIVALLGTNGAGKTTLLRTIGGLETQHAGSIHFAGADISTFDPTWRVGLGINQIAGGQALAEDLTVAENLRLFGHSLGRNRAALHAGIDRAFDVFPRLAERRNQHASTLSGGEKQMLALSKALILRPRLLIIDEFSLGLAPKVVGELLPVVSDLNRAGTAVLLVEQSVNIALSMASYASCLEKGAIVFEGPAATLRDDPDLMRSVYLEGVTKALAS